MNSEQRAKSVSLALAMLAAFAGNADTWTDPETGYTWTYQIYYESTGTIASIYNNGSGKVAISPKPTGPVTIPSTLGGYPVRMIALEAFFGCSGMTEVTIPEGVKEIGVYAFQGCSGLRNVIIPDSVKSIDGFAFYKCSSLVSVSLPYSLQGVVNEGDVFSDASSSLVVSYREPLTKTVVFDANGGMVEENERMIEEKRIVGNLPAPTREYCIFSGWFSEPKGGTKVSSETVVADNVTYYAHWEFIPQFANGYTWSGTIDADGLTLTNCLPKTSGGVVIPSSINGIAVKKLGDKIFWQNAENVETVVIQDGVKCLGENAFTFPSRIDGVVLKDMYLPPSVTQIDAFALSYFQGATLHWTVGTKPLNINTYFGFSNFYGNLDVTALGGVPDGMVKYGQYGWRYNEIGGRTTFRCKKAYYNEWRNFFGSSATFLGYIDDDYAYVPPVSTLTFNPNGGSVSELARVVVNSISLGTLPIPVKDGYGFTGWWTAETGGNRVTVTDTVSGDMTLHAHWVFGFNVSFDANGGHVEEVQRHVPQNGTIGDLPFPSRHGYKFDGWFTSPVGGLAVTAKTIVSGDVTCFAHWSISPYEWTYTGDASSGLTITGVSPRPSGFVEIPAVLDEAAVVKLNLTDFTNSLPVETSFVVPNGVREIGDWAFLLYYTDNAKEIYLPPSVMSWGKFAVNLTKRQTMHWTIGDQAVSFIPSSGNTHSIGTVWGTMDYIAVGCVPSGLKTLLDNQMGTPTITYRCKRSYKDEWEAFFANAGKSATFLGYIDDDYEYLDPILTINDGILESVQLMGGRDVVVPNGVTSIGVNAFAGNTLLRSVTIPVSVTNIAAGTFAGCTELESVMLPYALDVTMANAFPNGHGGVEFVFYNDDMTSGGDAGWGTDATTVHGGIVSRKSGAIGGNQVSWIEMRTQNPGRLSFWWKASSESDGDCVYDYAYLSVDGVPQGMLHTGNEEYELDGVAIGGKTDWQQVVLNVTGEGAHTIRWTYCKDEVDEGDTGEDCVWLDDVAFTPLVSVAYDLGGGTGAVPVGFTESFGTVVTLPTQSGFDRTDYIFNGWSDGATLYLAGASYTVPYGDVTLTAQWTKKTFLTFDLGGGTGTAPEVVRKLRGTVVTLPDQNGFDRTDYAFNGWSDGMTIYAAGDNYTMPFDDTTLTAQWIAKRFLTFTLDGGVGVLPVAIKDVPGATVTLPTADGFSKPKHTFVGWSDGASTYDAGANYTVTDSGVEFTAIWLRNELSVNISSEDVMNGGTLSTGGAMVSMTASPGTGNGGMISTALYCVIDLSPGPNAISYPVICMTAPPTGGFNTDEYKTTKLVLRRIEPGSFMMGGAYNVTLTKPYYIGIFEVTQKQYELVTGMIPSRCLGDMRPVERVSWDDVRISEGSFVKRICVRTGLDLDLPTEAQWEYACRAGTTSEFNNGGNSEDDLRMLGRYYANQVDDYGGYSSAHTTVGSYLPNAWGLYDMHGNIAEWCLDYYGDFIDGGIDPTGPSSGEQRVLKGGCWNGWAGNTSMEICYSSWRAGQDSNHGSASAGDFGFRIAMLENEALDELGLLSDNQLANNENATLDEPFSPDVHYTLDGTEPTAESPLYTGPFLVDSLGDVVIKAIAVMDDYFDSEVATFSFTRLPYSVAECIGVPTASVTTGGDAQWFRVLDDAAHDGVAAMRSDVIGDGQQTYVEMNVSGSGTISFWWKVSSQNKVRTNKHDYLSFSIDGTDVSTLGGGVIDWTNETFSVTGTGSHTLRWTYQKDSDGKSANEDCAWLDDVVWTPTPPFVVTLDANGGSVEPMTCSVPVGSNVGSLPIPSYEGHLFIGWFTGVEDGEQVTSETVVDSDTVFYAHWMDMPKEHAWTGGAGDGFFSTPGNWQYGVVPPDGADVRIGCAETATLTCDIAFRPKSITFPLSSANVTIVGEGSLSGLVAMTNESACHHVINVPVAFAENIEADVTMNKTSYMNFAGGMTAWSIKNAGEDAYYCGNISLEKEGDNWSADEKDFSIIVSGSSLMLPTSESIGAPNFKIETGSRVVINGDFTVSESEGNSTLRRFMTSRNAGVFEVKGHVIAAGNSFEACYYNASGLFVAKGLVCSVHKDYFHLNGRSGERANVKWVVGSDGLSSTSGSYWTLHNGGDTSLYPMADYSINSKIESHYPSLTIYTTDYFTNSIGRTVTVNKKLLATYAAVVRGKGKVVFNADFEFSKKLNAKYLVTLQIVAGVKSKIGQLVMDAGTTLALPTAGTATISLGGSFTTAGDGKVKIALGNTNEVVSVGTYTLLTATSLPDLSRLELVNAADGFVKFFASSDGKTLFLRVTTNKEFGPGDTTCIGGSVYLNSAQATWLNALGDYDTVNSAVETMDAKAFEEAYLLNLDVTDGGRGYSFEVTDCDATGENVVVTVRLVRTGAVQASGGGDAPINGVLRLYGSATPAASGFAPIAAATVSDATFANGGTATLTFGKDESIRFFKACIVLP